jgi:hypothetical protein
VIGNRHDALIGEMRPAMLSLSDKLREESSRHAFRDLSRDMVLHVSDSDSDSDIADTRSFLIGNLMAREDEAHVQMSYDSCIFTRARGLASARRRTSR